MKRFTDRNVILKSNAKVVIFFEITKKMTTFFILFAFLLLQRNENTEC